MTKMKDASSVISRQTGANLDSEIYLDHQASTPCDPAVLEAMMPYLAYEAANPSSPHRAGARVQKALDRAREQIAEALGCFAGEIFFTSGATESNNLAILGCRLLGEKRNRLVSTPIEHKSVLRPCESLAERGFSYSICPVRRDGQIELAALAELLDETTAIVSVQLANNEIGTIQPILEVGQLAHRVGALLHVDAAQAFGKTPIDVEDLGIDLLAASGHKCYGPKGAGVLFVRGGINSNIIIPTLIGGGQEAGIRAGTPNVPAIVGFGEASYLCREQMTTESQRIASMRDRLEVIIFNNVPGVRRNGAPGRRLAGSTSLTLENTDAEALIANVPEVAFSSSSACNSGALEPSHVLLALGLTREQAYCTVRLGVGRFTTPPEIEYAGTRIAEAATKLVGLTLAPQ